MHQNCHEDSPEEEVGGDADGSGLGVQSRRKRGGRPALPASERRSCRIYLALDEALLAQLLARTERTRESLHTCAARLLRERLGALVLVDGPSREAAEQLRVAAHLDEIVSKVTRASLEQAPPALDAVTMEHLRERLHGLRNALWACSVRKTS